MANEQKAVCGGFYVGEGLKMEGKVLSADGGGGGGDGYTIYFVNCSVDSATSVVTIEETFQEMYNNYLNKKIATLKNGSVLYMMGGIKDNKITFYRTYPTAESPYLNPSITSEEISITNTDQTARIRTMLFENLGGKLNKSGSTWTSTITYSKIKAYSFYLSTSIYLTYQLGSGQDIHYARMTGASPSSSTDKYYKFVCTFETDTGIHIDTFKIKQDNTIEYTSKDINA